MGGLRYLFLDHVRSSVFPPPFFDPSCFEAASLATRTVTSEDPHMAISPVSGPLFDSKWN